MHSHSSPVLSFTHSLYLSLSTLDSSRPSLLSEMFALRLALCCCTACGHSYWKNGEQNVQFCTLNSTSNPEVRAGEREWESKTPAHTHTQSMHKTTEKSNKTTIPTKCFDSGTGAPGEAQIFPIAILANENKIMSGWSHSFTFNIRFTSERRD